MFWYRRGGSSQNLISLLFSFISIEKFDQSSLEFFMGVNATVAKLPDEKIYLLWVFFPNV